MQTSKSGRLGLSTGKTCASLEHASNKIFQNNRCTQLLVESSPRCAQTPETLTMTPALDFTGVDRQRLDLPG